MASNNYFGFTHGGTQYSAAGAGAAFPTGQTGYAVAPAGAAATYGAQRGGCDPAYQAAGNYANAASGGAAVSYDYGYGRPAGQTYDASKTFYQQASANNVYTAAARSYNATRNKVGAYQTAQYVAGPTRNPVVAQVKPAAVNAVAAAVAASAYATAQVIQAPGPPQTAQSAAHTAPKQPAAPGNANYTNYESALYSAAAMYVAEQTNKPIAGHGPNYWPTGAAATGANAAGNGPNYKKQGGGHHGSKPRVKPQPKPQQLHYCEVCKISCAGPQTYREHLEGQKHKKRETSLKLAATAASVTQNRGNNLHCELCDVTCTGNDAYAAHVRGSKHQKVVKLHQKLGKPIPAVDPQSAKKVAKINFVQQTGTELSVPVKVETKGAGAAAVQTPSAAVSAVADAVEDDCVMEDVKPVGLEYIEEMKDEEGKTLSFNCKLCECKFNDPNAKEMHMKGRRHRLQYKKKVQPDLVVDFKPNPRQRRMAEAKAQRAVMQAEYWNQRLRDMSGQPGGENGDEDPMYWEERRRFEEEFDYIGGAWQRGGFPGGPRGAPHLRPPPFFGMLPGRRPESSDDRHVVARHAEIYPKEEELQTIQRIVSHTERALKFVSDALTDKPVTGEATSNGQATDGDTSTAEKDASKTKEDGRDNQMFSFQKEAEGGAVRILKGVMRVGLLAKGLLLQGDNLVQLVVLCADKPTHALMKRVAMELPVQLKLVSEDHLYTISMAPEDGAVMVTDGTITVKVSLTSPLLRDSTQDATNATSEQSVHASEDLLPREPCLQALAALRHAKWFQARATGLQSCVMIMRIMRDLCARTPTWTPLSQWAMELLAEKIISSAGIPLSPGDCMRRVMEGISTGIIINGPGILDPCEKESFDALSGLSKQQREDLTVSAQTFLRLIAFRQIHKVLGMDPLPAPKFQQRQWRFTRKRRRSGADGADEADGKMQKKDAIDAHKSDTSGK